jgi:hypothetical protein
MTLAGAIGRDLAANIDGLVYDTSATATGANVFERTMPSSPDRAVAIRVDGGPGVGSKSPAAQALVQILCRDVTSDDAEALATAVLYRYDRLDRVELDDDGDTIWLIGSTAVQSFPVPLGLDDNRRHEFAVNLDMRVHRPTTNRPETVGA